MSTAQTTKIALDESRMLMLGAQILLGFQLHAPFQNAFDHLSQSEKMATLLALGLLVLVMGLLIAPSARHRIVERGEATPALNLFITRMAGLTLLPLALALGLDLYLAGARLGGRNLAVLFGLGGFALACALWYGPWLAVGPQSQGRRIMDENATRTPIGKKIDHVLTEARVVLPGVQALLGFQLAIVLTTTFEGLSPTLKAWHGASIALIAVATALLITPAACHRIVYHGEDVPSFHRLASILVLTATVLLALGLSADVRVVAEKMSASALVAQAMAAACVTVLLALWHVWPAWSRWQRQPRHEPRGSGDGRNTEH
jgi:hypothetical protein